MVRLPWTVLLVSLLTTCACAPAPPTTRSVTVGAEGGTAQLSDQLDVELPPHAVPTATTLTAGPVDPVAQQALEAPVTVPGGPPVATPWTVIGSAVHIASTTALSAPATVDFRIPASSSGPFMLLTREDGTQAWHPVESSYDPTVGRVTAQTAHFSDWVVVGWVKDRAAALMQGVWDSIFGNLTANDGPPSCPAPPKDVYVSQLKGLDALGWCVAGHHGDQVTIRITNRRHYPIDVTTNDAGSAVADADGSTFQQLGASITRLTDARHHLTLLAGSTSGTVTLSIPPGAAARFQTQMDGEAYLLSVLDVSLQMAALVYGWLDHFGTPSDAVTNQLFTKLGAATCLKEAVAAADGVTDLSPDTFARLGKIATACADTVLGESALGTIAGIAGIITGLADTIVQSGHGISDTLTHDSVHLIEASTLAAATRVTTITPIRNPGPSGGTPAPGWQIVDDTTTTVDCGQPSPAATSNGIHSCSPTSADADVCWPAPEGFVYCLRDPWKKSLVQMPASNTSVPVVAPAKPQPLGIALSGGAHCILRNGGADSGRPADPNLYIAYYCGGRDIWGDSTGGSTTVIDKSATTWHVRTGTTTGPLRTETATQVYFAGN